MSESIFNIGSDGRLMEMVESPYDSENLLQELLAKYPNLLAGGQMNRSSPRRWLPVKREQAIPSKPDGAGRWSVDHLFLDQDAIPTLIEVKRSTDTRLRREVVGQMLDYAANAVMYWPVEQIQASYRETNDNADETLAEFLGEEAEPEEFWQNVKTNLQAGRIRMVFVADIIPSELERIVEFLNGQMDPAEVLAVEIKQFVPEVQEGDENEVRTLVPRVIGQTAEAARKKRPSSDTMGYDEGRQSFWEGLRAAIEKTDIKLAMRGRDDDSKMELDSPDPDIKIVIAAYRTKSGELAVRMHLTGSKASARWKTLERYIANSGDALQLPWKCHSGKRGKGFICSTRCAADIDAEDARRDQYNWIVNAVTELREYLLPQIR